MRSGAALREALLKLLGERPFDAITARDICAAASVHYATFFRHYTGKDALLDDIAAEQIDILVDLTLPIQQVSGHEAAVARLFAYIAEHRALWSALLNGGASAAMRDEWLARAKDVAASHRGVHGWLPQELGISASIAVIFETVTWWLRQPEGACSAAEAAAILSRLLAGVVASEGGAPAGGRATR